jgi:hypothetical protein
MLRSLLQTLAVSAGLASFSGDIRCYTGRFHRAAPTPASTGPRFFIKLLPAPTGPRTTVEHNVRRDGVAGPARVEVQREGRYANHLAVGYNGFEFIMDFGQIFEDETEPPIHTRIITNPEHFQAFVELMRLSLEQFEKKYGARMKKEEGG